MSETTNIPYNLSIRITTDGFSFTLLQNASVILRRSVQCGSHSLPENLRNELLQQNLLGKRFQRVNVLLHTHSQMVPNELYRKEDEDTWLKSLRVATTRQEIVGSEYIPQCGCYNVFAIPQNIHDVLREAFGDEVDYSHVSTELIGCLLSNKEKCLGVYLQRNSVDIVAVKHGQLLLSNCFSIQNEADAAYWILNVLEQFKLPVRVDTVLVFPEGSSVLSDLLQKLLS